MHCHGNPWASALTLAPAAIRLKAATLNWRPNCRGDSPSFIQPSIMENCPPFNRLSLGVHYLDIVAPDYRRSRRLPRCVTMLERKEAGMTTHTSLKAVSMLFVATISEVPEGTFSSLFEKTMPLCQNTP